MNGTGVFVLRDPTTLIPMQTASFASEDDFQHLLANFPELLAGDQIDADTPRRFILVAREQPVASEEGGGNRWSLDHLFLDQEGIPTLVEVKRGTDTRIRREVVGQMLDYAANAIVYWPVEELRRRFESRCEGEGQEPASILATLLGGSEEEDPDVFWGRVRTNLQAGRIRMLFVADRIPAELRRVVEFLNGQMQPAEVLAVELRQYEGQGLRTLVPVVIGQTQEAAQKKSAGTGPRPKRAWDEAAILSAITDSYGAAIGREVERIMDWIRRNADQAPGFGLREKGYRLPTPRFFKQQLQGDVDKSGKAPPAPVDVRDILEVTSSALLTLPRTYPDRSMAWVIASDLLDAEIRGKQAIPVVVDGKEIKPPRHNIDHCASVTLNGRGNSDTQVVYIVDNI